MLSHSILELVRHDPSFLDFTKHICLKMHIVSVVHLFSYSHVSPNLRLDHLMERRVINTYYYYYYHKL